MNRRIIIFGFLSGALMFSSCVSMSKFNALKADAMRLDTERERGLVKIDELEQEKHKLQSEKAQLNSQYEKLQKDYQYLKDQQAQLQTKYDKLLTEGSAEATRMLKQLQENQAKLQELEILLKSREEAIAAIRRKVTDALVGFDGKGLTITQRNGMVYVSMEDKLLFKSGSFDIDPEGERAVKQLSNVLASNSDINVMVEGHTDNVPYRGVGQLKDNWDLSVKRATTVTRLLLENKGIDPQRITAAGRSEYLKLENEDTASARAKNRRTEIILTPKLDELMKLMETN